MASAKSAAARLPSSALLAFGQRVTAGDAFDDMVAAGRWEAEHWSPTFVEEAERRQIGTDWKGKQVLRRSGPDRRQDASAEPRLMVASSAELPSLYFVEWHYIDFVLSCVGNVSEAARVLGVRRSTLQRKRKKNPPHR
jgi:hypothetical protein